MLDEPFCIIFFFNFQIMSEITNQFKEIIKKQQAIAIKVNNVLKEEAGATTTSTTQKNNNDSLLTKNNQYSEFSKTFRTTSLQLLRKVQLFERFLMEMRAEFLNVNKFFSIGNATMPENSKKLNKNRDEIELEAKNQLKSCWEDLIALKKGLEIVATSNIVNNNNNTTNNNRQTINLQQNQQLLNHFGSILDYLHDKILIAQELLQKQQTQVFKQQLEEPNEGHLALPPIVKSSFDSYRAVPQRVDTATETEASLSQTERQQLEQENLNLQSDLETMLDQAKHIERQVMEISEMQRFFSSKMSEQNETVEQIAQLAAKSKANVENATVELQKAAKGGVSFRTLVMVFLWVCSFALLYLHAISK